MRKTITVTDAALLEAMQHIPKAVVHVHLDGSVPAEDVLKLSRQQEIDVLIGDKDPLENPLPKKSLEERKILTPNQLREYWAQWDTYSVPCLFSAATNLMQTYQGAVELARAHVRSLVAQNIIYAETRFAPQYSTRDGKISIDAAVEAVLVGLDQGMQEARTTGKDITVKLIVCIGREEPLEVGIKVARAALKYQNKGVVALDLACYEALDHKRDAEQKSRTAETHYPAFELTFDSALKRTVHAGEMMKDDEANLRNIHYALTQLRADGIGHGIPLWRRTYQGNDLVQLMLDRNVRLESNPVSNLFLGFIEQPEELHLDELLRAGVLVTVNIDDPAMWPNGSLAHNLYIIEKLYGRDVMHTLNRNAVNAAFGLSGQKKQAILKKFS